MRRADGQPLDREGKTLDALTCRARIQRTVTELSVIVASPAPDLSGRASTTEAGTERELLYCQTLANLHRCGLAGAHLGLDAHLALSVSTPTKNPVEHIHGAGMRSTGADSAYRLAQINFDRTQSILKVARAKLPGIIASPAKEPEIGHRARVPESYCQIGDTLNEGRELRHRCCQTQIHRMALAKLTEIVIAPTPDTLPIVGAPMSAGRIAFYTSHFAHTLQRGGAIES